MPKDNRHLPRRANAMILFTPCLPQDPHGHHPVRLLPLPRTLKFQLRSSEKLHDLLITFYFSVVYYLCLKSKKIGKTLVPF
jgi:hypothetical protein